MRVFIAEDDQVLADGLLRSLRSAGYAVDQVSSGTEADAALAAHEFDMVILDLGLPVMHGFEVLKKLRGRGITVPVLILTAADSVEERVKGLDYGADDYMAKPFSLQELEARVRALVRRADRHILLVEDDDAIVDALLVEAARQPAVRVVRASVAPTNAPSLALIRRAHFVQVGQQWDAEDGLELVFERPVIPED